MPKAPSRRRRDSEAKVFCFFFSKKKCLPPSACKSSSPPAPSSCSPPPRRPSSTPRSSCQRRRASRAPPAARPVRAIGRTAPTTTSRRASIRPPRRSAAPSASPTPTTRPDTLDVLWLQLDQNIYRPDARAALVSPFRTGGFTQGDVIDSVSVEQGGRTLALTPLISDTRMQLRLAEAAGAAWQARPAHCLALHGAGRLGRPHRGDLDPQRRHLRDRPVVSAHGRL